MLLGKVSWESVLKDRGVSEGWTLLKNEILKAQEQAFCLCLRMSQLERRLTWLNREFLLRVQEKKFTVYGRRVRQLGKSTRM